MFQMSLDLCRCCLDDYVVSIMFFDLCLVDGVCRSVGRLTFFQAQREQWVSNSQRTVVEGHSQLQCKACQGTQVIAKKTFQVESVDRTWK
jgi:hypothetical protein